MLTELIPEEIKDLVEFVQTRRICVSLPEHWALILETHDEEGVEHSELMCLNGPLNINMISFWLLVDMAPPSFNTSGPGIFHDTLVDLERIDWLTEQLSWIPGMSNYDPDRHVNYAVAHEVCELKLREHDLDMNLRLITITGDLNDGMKQFFRALGVNI